MFLLIQKHIYWSVLKYLNPTNILKYFWRYFKIFDNSLISYNEKTEKIYFYYMKRSLTLQIYIFCVVECIWRLLEIITHFSKEFYFLVMWRFFSFSTGYNGFCKDTIKAEKNKKLSNNNTIDLSDRLAKFVLLKQK